MAQKYWIGVLEGRIDADDDAHLYPTVESLEALREEVAELATRYLESTDTQALNTAKARTTWGGQVRELVPAQVFLRTFTHFYHHQGQVVAMCRLLGQPAGGLDYPFA